NNASVSSLPGGGLRRQHSNASQRGSAPVRDPVQVLSRILGVDYADLAASTLQTNKQDDSLKPELVEDVDFGGLSLEEYAAQQLGDAPEQDLSVLIAEDCIFYRVTELRSGRLIVR